MKLCKEQGCVNKHHSKGWCQRHYKKYKAENNEVCIVEGCTGKSHAKNLCGIHYQRLRRYGDYNISYNPRKESPQKKLCDTSFRLPEGFFLKAPGGYPPSRSAS